MGSDGYRHKGGKTLELRYSTTIKASRKALHLLAQDPWKAVGIKIDLNDYSTCGFCFANPPGIFHTGNFDIGAFANPPGYDPYDNNPFMSTQTPETAARQLHITLTTTRTSA